MKGYWIYLSFAALMGVLAGLEGSLFFLFLFMALFLFLVGKKKYSVSYLLIALGIFLLFFFQAQIQERQHQTKLTGSEQQFQLTFQHPMKVDGAFFTAYGKDERTGEKVVLQYRLSSEQEKKEMSTLTPGYSCTIKGGLEEPDLPGNLETFNYREYLHKENIFWMLKAEQFSIQQCKVKKSVISSIQSIRQKGIHYIHAHFPQQTAPLAAALIFGDRNSIDPQLMTAYQKLGIVHLLAISGLHVGMLFGILFYIGIRLNIPREKMTDLLIAFLPFYMVLTGGSPSVVRACFMMMLALLFMRFQSNRALPSDILSIVFMIYIFFQPFVIYDIGFQLSFSVTFSLILSTPIFAKYRNRSVLMTIVTSVIAQIASMPFLLYHFYEFSIVSVFANILYVPLYSVVILPAMLLLLFLHLMFGDYISPVLLFFDSSLVVLEKVTVLLSLLPFNTMVLGRPSHIIILLFSIGLPLAFFKWETSKTIQDLILPIFLVLSLLLIPFTISRFNVTGEVTVIDVGQGDSILIRLPMNKGTYLIDTGGTMHFPTEEWEERLDPFEVGKDVLVPFLKSKGITKIDKLILTHRDMDHVGGAKAVLGNVKVKEVVMPKVDKTSELELEIMSIGQEKGIPIHFVQNGDKWRSGVYTFMVLSPSTANELEKNDQSIVIYTKLGGRKWLFAGDLEETGERKLLTNYPRLEADVLKVGHHGSKTSSTDMFLDQLRPRIAIISAGKDNRFGHPHGVVLERLESRKVNIFRTDQDGAVTYKFKQEKGTFYTHHHMIKQKLK